MSSGGGKSGSKILSDILRTIKKIIELAKAIVEAAAGNWIPLIKKLLALIPFIILSIFVMVLLFSTTIFVIVKGVMLGPNEISMANFRTSIVSEVSEAYSEVNAEIINKINKDYEKDSSKYDASSITIINPLDDADIAEEEIYKLYSMFTVYKDRQFVIRQESSPLIALLEQALFYDIKELKKIMTNNYDKILTYTVHKKKSTDQPTKINPKTGVIEKVGEPETFCDFVYTISVSDIDTLGPALFGLADRTNDESVPIGARINEIEIAKTKAKDIVEIFAEAIDEYTGEAGGGGVINVTAKDYSVFVNNYTVTDINFTPSAKMRVPLRGTYSVTSNFGMRMHPIDKKLKMHTGIDIKAQKGTPIYSIANGIVVKEGYADGYGNFVIVYHGEIDGFYYFTTYNHINGHPTVKEGETVTKSTIIGEVGSSGKSTGPHLHFEVRVGQKNKKTYTFKFKDPSLFLTLSQ